MDYFIDIVVQPDQDMHENALMNLLYSKLHRALVKLNSDFIGVSFPGIGLKPGKQLRLHGTKTHLEQLVALDWIGGLTGYCRVSAIQAVPPNVQYRTFFRKQPTMSNAKLKRLQKRGAIPDSDLKEYKAKMFRQGLDNPYLDLVSESSGRTYRRFIALGDIQAVSTQGAFDTFGLSKGGTIPWF